MTANSRPYPRLWIFILAALTALGPLSIDMYLPALPAMAKDFSVSTALIANSLPAYFLGLALGQLAYGPLSDAIGRKKPLYFGLLLFAAASMLCMLASNVWMLFAARFLQALGGCVGLVIARAAIRDRLNVQQSAQAFASMMLVMGVAPILAPTLGAWLLILVGWQGIFAVLAIFGLVNITLVHFHFDETLHAEKRLTLTPKSIAMTYWQLLKDNRFRTPALTGGLLSAALFSYISAASGLFIEILGFSEQQFAYAFALNASGLILLSQCNGRLVKKIGVLSSLQLGATIQIGGACLLLLASKLAHVHAGLVMTALFLVVSGIGLTGPNATALALEYQGERAGMASALMGSLQFSLGLSGGLALYWAGNNHLEALSTVMTSLITLAMLCILVMRGRASKALKNQHHPLY